MIAERISELMGNASLTTADLAKLVGVERPSVSRWINGRARPKPEYLEKLASIFGVSVSFISGHDPSPRVNPGKLLQALSAAKIARDELDKAIRALESARGLDLVDLRGASLVAEGDEPYLGGEKT